MSWLNDEKAKADAEAAERAAEDAKERENWERRRRGDEARANELQKEKLADLHGKTCRQDGKEIGRFSSTVTGTVITFFTGDIKLGEITCGSSQGREYDSDGCSWPDGIYHNDDHMEFYLPHRKKDGNIQEIYSPSKYSERRVSYSGSAYLEYLAQYLLNFMTP